MANIKANLLWGLGIGVFGAIVLAGIATGQYLLEGEEVFVRNGISYRAALALYAGSGLIGGAILGLLRPLYSKSLGAAAGGFIVALIVYGGAVVILAPELSPVEQLALSVVMAAFVGVPAGLYHAKASKADCP